MSQGLQGEEELVIAGIGQLCHEFPRWSNIQQYFDFEINKVL